MQVSIIPSTINHYNLIPDGLKNHGIDFVVTNNPNTKIVFCWGWRKGKEYRQKGHEVLVFERAYLGDRYYNTAIGWNGLNGHADFCLKGDEKLKGKWPYTQWHDGEYVVIMGQVAGDASLKGQNLTLEYERWAKEAERHYNIPVYFRPHPHTQRANFKPKVEHINGDLDEVLYKAHLVMCYNSNSSVDAVLNGAPCITFDKGSMAYDVTGHSVCDRIKPDRKEWLAGLSNCQWTPDEIERGDYIERMLCKQVN